MASDTPRAGAPSCDGPTAAAAGARPTATPLACRRFFCSWSGGKDACLALQRATLQGGRPAALLCMLREDGRVSRGHGLPLELIQEQAAALRLPLVTRATTWDGYETTYVEALHALRRGGVQAGVFGDIDLQAHRDWVEDVCAAAGLSCHLPLWQEPRRRLLDEFLAGGSRASIVAVDASRLSVDYLGRELDDALIARLEADGSDACGEEGEYHTMVALAPPFAAPVPLMWDGVEERDGHWVLHYGAAAPSSESVHH